MSLVDDLFDFARQGAQYVVEGVTSLISSARQAIERRAQQQATEQQQTEAAPAAAATEAAEKPDDIGTLLNEINSISKLRLEQAYSPEQAHENLISIGIYAYKKMLQYKQIVELVEEQTGVSIGAANVKREMSNVSTQTVYEVRIRFIAYADYYGNEESRPSRIFLIIDSGDRLASEIQRVKEQFIESLHPSFKARMTRVEEELLSKTIVTERNLMSYEESLEGGNYEV